MKLQYRSTGIAFRGLAVAVTAAFLTLIPLPGAAASSWNPTLLVNTESFNVIDDGDSTTDIELRFGETLGEKLFYDRSETRFQLTRGLFIQGNLTATGSLSVRGVMSGASLRVDHNADVWGKLTVSGTTLIDGATTINNTLDTTGAITTDGNLTINEDNGAADATLSFGNDSGVETIKFNDTSNQFEISDNLDVTDTISAGNNITTTADMTLNSDNGAADATLTFGNDAGAETMKFNDTTNQFELSDDLNVRGTLSGATLNVTGNITGSGNLAVEGTMGVDGAATFKSTLTTTGQISGSGGLAVTSDINTRGNLKINGDSGAADAVLTFGNDAGAETLQFNDTSNEFDLSDDLNVTGTFDATGSMTTNADMTINADNGAADAVLTFGNDAGVETIKFNDTTNQFEFSDDVSITGNLDTTGTITTDTNLTINEDNGAADAVLTFGNDAGAETLQFSNTTNQFELSDDLNVRGVLSGATLNVTGNITGSGNLAVEGTIGVDGAATFKSTLTTTGQISGSGGLAVTSDINTRGNMKLNGDNGAADAVLTFGNDAGEETIKFNDTLNRFEASDDFKAAGNLSGSTLTVDGTVTIRGVDYTFPTTNGNNGQVITTNGNGELSWSDSTVGVGSGGVLFMAPEYPHAVYFGSGSTYIGQLSYSFDATNKENYYHWTSTKAALQDYWMSVRVRVPDNFSTWDGNQPLTFKYRTASASNAVNYANVKMLDTAGAMVILTNGALLANTSWTTTTITGPQAAGTYTPGGYITLLIKVATTSGGSVDAGSIGVNWETTAP